MSDPLDHVDLDAMLESLGIPSHLRSEGRRLLAERLRTTVGAVALQLEANQEESLLDDDPFEHRHHLLDHFTRPKPVKQSSRLTPIRRRIFLKPDCRDSVHELSDEVAARGTLDPEFPLDLCAVHARKRGLFCYSSGYFRPPRAQGPDPLIDGLVSEALDAQEERGRPLWNRPLKQVPRAFHEYAIPPYRWMKVVAGGPSDGSILGDHRDYPIRPEETDCLVLDMGHWARWGRIVGLGPRHEVATFRRDGEVHLTVRDPYHLMVQQLTTRPDPDSSGPGLHNLPELLRATSPGVGS